VQLLTAHLIKLENFMLVHHEDDKIERDDFLGLGLANDKILPGQEEWIPYALNRASTLNVDLDVVVTDFLTTAGAKIADDFKLPLVVNVPNMLTMYEIMAHQRIINMENSAPCCGCLCVAESCVSTAV
jgi:hypothetical protein